MLGCSIQIYILPYLIVHVAPCANGNVRLVNGSDNTQGKIEVCVDQMWTDVCDKNWSISDADVVCRQLGYSGNGENETWVLIEHPLGSKHYITIILSIYIPYLVLVS